MTAKKTPAKKTPAKKPVAKKPVAKNAAPKKDSVFLDSDKFVSEMLSDNSEKILAQIPDTIDVRAGKNWLKKFFSKLKK